MLHRVAKFQHLGPFHTDPASPVVVVQTIALYNKDKMLFLRPRSSRTKRIENSLAANANLKLTTQNQELVQPYYYYCWKRPSLVPAESRVPPSFPCTWSVMHMATLHVDIIPQQHFRSCFFSSPHFAAAPSCQEEPKAALLTR